MKRALCICLSLSCLFLARPAFAQRDLEIPIQFAFDVINPGARSLALSGAFIGLADDATAASTNPAGLVQLVRPEVSVEGRGWEFVTAFVEGGRLSGPVTNTGIDTVSGPVFGEATERVGGLSFLSFVYPYKQWRFAGYRQEASRLKSTVATQGALFVDFDNEGVFRNFREYPSKLNRQLDVINYGGSAAFRAGIVSVGLDVHFSQLDYDTTLEGFDLPLDFYASATYASRRYSRVETGDGTGVGFSVGALVIPSRHVQFGFSYRRNASFDFEGALDYPLIPDLATEYTGEFKVPDNIGGGVAVRPLEGLLVAFDVNRVTYSDLTEFIQKAVRFHPEEAPLYNIDDATELHLGVEYVLTRVNVLPAVRIGVWRETEHAVSYSGENELYLAAASLAQDITHVSFGGGIAPSPKFEFNAGFDFSDRANTMSFSAIFRF